MELWVLQGSPQHETQSAAERLGKEDESTRLNSHADFPPRGCGVVMTGTSRAIATAQKPVTKVRRGPQVHIDVETALITISSLNAYRTTKHFCRFAMPEICP